MLVPLSRPWSERQASRLPDVPDPVRSRLDDMPHAVIEVSCEIKIHPAG